MKRYLKLSFYNRYKPHYIPNIKLALPVVFSQAGQMVVGLVDTLMVGQLGTTELAAVSFANSIFILGFVISIGLAYAVTPMVGKSHGAEDRKKCGYWLKQGLWINIISAVMLIGVMVGVSFLMPFIGQEEQVVKYAKPYYFLLVSSMLPFAVFMVFKQFAEGIANTRIAMVVTLLANVINILLNYLLIFGKIGLPELGLNGAGWATLISRIFMAIVFVVLFWNLPFFDKYKQAYLKTKLNLREAFEVLRVGFPIGGQMFIEVFAFSMGAIMMGWIGQVQLAAHQIVITLASLTYMMSLGLSSAATIKVSNFLGAKDYKSLKYAAYAILHKVIVFMAVNGILFYVFREAIPALFVNDQEVVMIAAQLMIVAGVFQIFDGLQAVWIGILRGLQDVNMPSVIAFVTWILIALPICYICGFVLNFGAAGVWFGYLSGLMIASILLQFRFRKIIKRYI